MRIDPVSLRLFLSVAELGTIAGAADREHIAASAISKRISDLEDALATDLFARSNKGLELTPSGVELQNLAREILNSLDNVYSHMRGYARGARGLVRIHANVSIIAQFLPRDLQTFVERYPLVQLQVEEKISTAILRGVALNAADIGFYADLGTKPEGVVSLPYRDDRLVIVAPRGGALSSRTSMTCADLLEHPFIGLQTGSFINLQLLREGSERGLPVNFRVQVNSYDAVCLMVEAGMGLGILPRRLALRYASTFGIDLIALDAPWADRKLNICIRSFESLPAAASLLIDHLQQLGRPADE
ncbi:LysR family transcriptional regulator [Caballeronia cordobensis]|uniref:LysR family transcriptional regulator n=1 Tax=Caballeronia cordobensis TaxID=1353886 RepID=UPI0002388D06|nr:LysR family transcriptional regulator [Burkholderia sp. YI23]BAO92799.1 LysR family transcriptional regulator [Burkholderia sp. RPE67]